MVRKNDIDYTNSSVRYFTTDNSAIANKHYAESRGVLHFDFGEDRKFISIEICTYIPANHNNRFYVHIEGYDISTKVATPSVAEVTILRKPIVPFFHKEPLVEMISSNLHYGTAGHKSLVCITVSHCVGLYTVHVIAVVFSYSSLVIHCCQINLMQQLSAVNTGSTII